ncbi:Serine/arginine-rich splicing factor SR45a [Zea mays]|uniref:Serine/arginine-rich splicing factor SR45a n=1 Tax=Zea mays TaxID=4577 RepID=A0A1D6MGP3_MAIZE|nr:Serine/arginine-rich splicing factor SR45a [Zea mays]
MPRPAAHACAVGVPQHPHRVACLQSRPHPLLLAQRDHQRLDVHRPARVHAVLRPHPGAPRPVLHQGVWYDWAPLLLRRPSSNQGRLALAPRTHDPLLLYPQRRAPPSCFWQRKPSPCGKLPTRWNAQPLVGSTQPLRDVTNSVIRASHKHALNFSLSQPYRFLGVYGFPRQSGGITSRGLVCWRKMASC